MNIFFVIRLTRLKKVRQSSSSNNKSGVFASPDLQKPSDTRIMASIANLKQKSDGVGNRSRDRQVLSPVSHMDRMKLISQAPLDVGENTQFHRYYNMDEWQFPRSKNVMLSDYQHACQWVPKRYAAGRSAKSQDLMTYDQRDSKNVKTMFGHPTAHITESLYIDSFQGGGREHKRALHKSKKCCQSVRLSSTDVTQLAEGMALMKNVMRK